MKIQSRRAAIVLILLFLFVGGIILFIGSYIKNASTWANFPANKHLYTNGHLNLGTIYDRSGLVLLKTENGERKYNDNSAIRTAVMHAVGDSQGNVSTGAQTAFRSRLSGWNIINGTYHTTSGGSDITLTIDANLCLTAYKALAGRKGTIGVYNYKTGDILCMVSSPSFDPENPPSVSSGSEKYKGVYVNRFLSSAYTPGSVFKLVTLAAAIDNISGVTSKTFYCNSVLNTGDGKVTCPEAHGKQTLGQALANSCNVTFGGLAIDVGSSTLEKYAEKAGFNSNMYVSGIKTSQGKVNLKSVTKANLGWAGIGQYTDTANPAAYMAYVGAIANGGVRVTPNLIKGSSAPQTRLLSSNTAGTIKSLMRNDTLVNYGDGNYPGLELAAKSGTAQLSDGESPNAWFVGFSERDDLPLAFVVVIENGGSGSKVAGPVANKVMQAALKLYAGK